MVTSPSRRRTLVAVLLGVAAIPAFFLIPAPLLMFIPLWAFVVSGTLYLSPGLRSAIKRRREIAAVEAEFPDALFILGSRIAEGAPVESALRLTAEATRGSAVAKLFETILRDLHTSRRGLDEVLFSPDGVLSQLGSRTVPAAFRMVVEVSGKDSATAGKTIVETSAYMRDLREVDSEIRRDLSSTVDAMQATAAFFAPMVLGVTCALYGLLSRAFSRLVVLGLSPSMFVAIVGLYLILTVAVITYFRVGVEVGRDPFEIRAQLARAWPVSMVVFTGAYVIAQAGLAG